MKPNVDSKHKMYLYLYIIKYCLNAHPDVESEHPNVENEHPNVESEHPNVEDNNYAWLNRLIFI